MQIKFSICKQKILKVPLFLRFSNLTYNILHNVYLFTTKNEYLSIAPLSKAMENSLFNHSRLTLDNGSTMARQRLDYEWTSWW